MWVDAGDAHLRLVEIGREGRDQGVQVRQQHGGGERLQPALRVPHRRRGVVVDGPKVAVAGYLQSEVHVRITGIYKQASNLQQCKWSK